MSPVKNVYANGIKETGVVTFTGFMEIEPIRTTLVFNELLNSRTYIEIKKCELLVTISQHLAIEEIPVVVKFFMSRNPVGSLQDVTTIPADTPFQKFLIKGDEGSDFKMNLTNLLRETLEWRKGISRHTAVIIEPSNNHPNEGTISTIKVHDSSIKILIEYTHKGKSF